MPLLQVDREAPRAIQRYCPCCAQRLLVPTDDLSLEVTCPRCRTPHRVDLFVDHETPIPATPVRALEVRPASDPTPPPEVVHEAELIADPYASPAPQAQNAGHLSDPTSGLRRVAGAVGVGVSLAGRMVSWMLRASGFLDGLVAGRRGRVIVATSTLVVLAPLLGEWRDLAWLNAASVCLLAAVVGVFVLAKIEAIRDDEGLFRSVLLWSFIVDAWEVTASGATDFVTASPHRRTQLAGAALIQLSVVSQAGFMLADAFTGASSALSIPAAIVFGFGVLLYVSGWSKGRTAGQRSGLLVRDEGVAAVEAAVMRLPPLITCGASEANQLARDADNPLIAGLVHAMSTFRPRGCSYERDYQNKLLRRLVRDMSDASPEDEVTIRSEDGALRGRIDIRLGDCVLIEMKAFLKGSEADRCVGQLRKYLEIWRGRGPVVLVLCGTGPEAAERVRREIADMRTQGAAVVAFRTAV